MTSAAYEPVEDFADSFSVLGYVGADEFPDIVVSAPGNTAYATSLFILQPVPDNSGYATYGGSFGPHPVASWGSSSVLSPISPISDLSCGTAVTGVGDTNGDGVPDFVTVCSGIELHLVELIVSYYRLCIRPGPPFIIFLPYSCQSLFCRFAHFRPYHLHSLWRYLYLSA